ncbi:hypothetical protein GQ42DRAFT_161289, partial [Ramicandelaber brevisporus]
KITRLLFLPALSLWLIQLKEKHSLRRRSTIRLLSIQQRSLDAAPSRLSKQVPTAAFCLPNTQSRASPSSCLLLLLLFLAVR